MLIIMVTFYYKAAIYMFSQYSGDFTHFMNENDWDSDNLF